VQNTVHLEGQIVVQNTVRSEVNCNAEYDTFREVKL
jgi:hypothetical protein